MAATIQRTAYNQYSSSVSGGTTPSDLFIPADVPDWTKNIDRVDTPILKAISRFPAQDVPNIKRQWGWSSKDPFVDALNDATNVNTTDTEFVVDNGAYFAVNDVVAIDPGNSSEELIRVTAVSGNTLTVSRGFAGTTAASHNDNAVMVIIGPAVAENADDPNSPTTQGEIDYNHPQLMTFTWQYSDRAAVTPTYESRNFAGNRDMAELRKKMEETAPLRLELTLLLGQRAQGTGTTPSAMGGLRQSSFITTRTSLSSNPLTEYDFMQNLQTVWNMVGPSKMPRDVYCSSLMARVISSWYNSTRRTDGSTEKINTVFNEINTPFGNMRIHAHYLMVDVAPARMYFLNAKDIGLAPYASGFGWQTGKLSTQGAYRKGYLRGDWTAVFRDPDTRLELHTFSTTQTDYPGLA